MKVSWKLTCLRGELKCLRGVFIYLFIYQYVCVLGKGAGSFWWREISWSGGQASSQRAQMYDKLSLHVSATGGHIALGAPPCWVPNQNQQAGRDGVLASINSKFLHSFPHSNCTGWSVAEFNLMSQVQPIERGFLAVQNHLYTNGRGNSRKISHCSWLPLLLLCVWFATLSLKFMSNGTQATVVLS